MFVVPALNPNTTPAGLTEATVPLELVHGAVAAGNPPAPINVILAPSQTEVEPETVGTGFTVSVNVVIQPFVLV